MKQNTKQNIFFLALALVISVGIHYVGAWTGPTGTAPANDVSGLIDVSTDEQIKGHTAPTVGILLDVDDPTSTTDTFSTTNSATWLYTIVDDDTFVESLSGPEFICADSTGKLILCP
jgi:hypothetical protein